MFKFTFLGLIELQNKDYFLIFRINCRFIPLFIVRINNWIIIFSSFKSFKAIINYPVIKVEYFYSTFYNQCYNKNYYYCIIHSLKKILKLIN